LYKGKKLLMSCFVIEQLKSKISNEDKVFNKTEKENELNPNYALKLRHEAVI